MNDRRAKVVSVRTICFLFYFGGGCVGVANLNDRRAKVDCVRKSAFFGGFGFGCGWQIRTIDGQRSIAYENLLFYYIFLPQIPVRMQHVPAPRYIQRPFSGVCQPSSKCTTPTIQRWYRGTVVHCTVGYRGTWYCGARSSMSFLGLGC